MVIMMKTLHKLVVAILFLLFSSAGAFAQVSPIQPVSVSRSQIDTVIKELTKKEDEFRVALGNYVFDRSATIQTIGLGGLITGTYRRDSAMTFTESGERFEKIEYHPVSTLREITVTAEDLEDLGGVNPFAINPADVALYNFNFIGKQRIDELNLFVFDVTPKVIPNPKKSKKRLFTGRIWVDDEDMMIVKSKGKGVPEGDQRFPVVETWRENIDGKYWFPAYTSSDDDLVFKSGQVVKLRMRVRYKNYKQGRTEVIILDDDVTVVDEDEKAPPKLKDDKTRPPS